MEAFDQVYQKNQDFIFRQIENETILVPIRNHVGDMNHIYTLNPIGALVWEYLDSRNSLQNIKNLIMEKFEVSSEKAGEDLCEFIGELKGISAIFEVDPSGTEGD